MRNKTSQLNNDIPHSWAAERNKTVILEKLHELLTGYERVLEIGSGTGQHAIFFSDAMPGLSWQPSDLAERVAVTNAVIASANLANIKATVALDAGSNDWPSFEIDVIYTANTAHIMPWEVTQNMIVQSAKQLKQNDFFIMYGPFKYEGDFTSESNQLFDTSLKRSDRAQGIRDIEGVLRVANHNGLELKNDFDMPANNRLLVFEKVSK